MINFYLPHRKKDEKIILLYRRHPFILIVKIAFWFVVAMMPLFFYLILGEIVSPFLSHPLVAPIVILFIITYYLYIWLFMLYTFVDYYLDVWIVTNYRVVNVEQKGLFNRVISEQRLYRIQDVTAEIKGIFSTFLDYGTVYIQTAGEQTRFIFKQIKGPRHCATKITRLIEQNKKFHELMQQKDEIHIK